MQRRLLVLLACCALVSGALPVFGQPFPARPIRLIVSYPPGGQSDLVGRLVAQQLGEQLDTSIVVENRPGANGTVGIEAGARAAPDGYTLVLAGGGGLTLAPLVDSSVRYDALRDFIPLARVSRTPHVLATRAGLGLDTVPQLIDYAKRNPGKLTCASAGPGATMAIEAFKTAAGVNILSVPYKGFTPAVLDVASGQVDLVVADVAVIAPFVQSGRIRVIANAGEVRSRAYPDARTFAEESLADVVSDSWQSIVVPRGTPADIVARLQNGLQAMVASIGFRDGLVRLGFETIEEHPDRFPAVLLEELARNRVLARRAGVQVLR